MASKHKLPVTKKGESGIATSFATNYIKLKSFIPGIYQYIVKIEPQVDALFKRVELIKYLSDILGPVRLFDGNVLFLPIQLKVSSNEYFKYFQFYQYSYIITKNILDCIRIFSLN